MKRQGRRFQKCRVTSELLSSGSYISARLAQARGAPPSQAFW